MTQGRRQESGYVLRRVVSGKVLIGTYFPKVGPVFWDRIPGPERSAPDHCGLTTYAAGAERFRPGYVQIQERIDEIWASNQAPDSVVSNQAGGDRAACSSGVDARDFEALAKLAGIDIAGIASWFLTAPWIEVPAPPIAFFLRRYDGIIGYRDEWTADLAEAYRFDEPRVLPSRVLGDVRRHGRLVHSLEAEVLPAAPSAARDSANHALEADVQWTLHRHQWGSPETARRALQHAGTAGWIYAEDGRDRVSGHISAFPQLLEAFEMGRALYASLHATSTKKEA